jgi:signal transduction histidine kinase
VIALIGWAAAAIALVMAAAVSHSLSTRGEAVARACHELRGPLSAIRLGLELGIRRGQLPPDRLRAIELELGRAALALDDLALAPQASLLRPRRQAARVRERVDVQELLADSVEAWRGAAAARDAELSMRWSGSGAAVLGERLRLAQATGNLIANAIEHGAGPIEVRGRRDRATVRIEVVDRGPGLSRPLAELVGGRRRSRSQRGHGLSIVSRVASAHAGRLSSAPSNRGARLVLELPLAEPTAVSRTGG